MSHSVSIVKHLILLEVQLKSLLVREIMQIFLNFNEFLNACKRAGHSMERFINCLVNWQQIALSCSLTCALGFMVVVLLLDVQVLTYTSLTKGDLVGHAEGVNDRVMLITIEDTSNGLLDTVVLLSLVVVMQLLRMVHMLYMLC